MSGCSDNFGIVMHHLIYGTFFIRCSYAFRSRRGGWSESLDITETHFTIIIEMHLNGVTCHASHTSILVVIPRFTIMAFHTCSWGGGGLLIMIDGPYIKVIYALACV